MRKKVLFNDNWSFTKDTLDPAKIKIPAGEAIVLPHTWNALDGQDGGNDYYRGRCWYTKAFNSHEIRQGEEAWLEFEGANMSARVFLNGKLIGRHEGGYSTFRVNMTTDLEEENLLLVSVDNSRSRVVYPQKADFTFYGGIYRGVNLITVPKGHFALGYHGSPGIRVKAEPEGDLAKVTIDTWLENVPDGTHVHMSIEGVGEADALVLDGHAATGITIPQVRLWDGLKDPYLYTAVAELDNGGDKVETKFGCRTFSFDADKGFFLNGRSYPLCGAARHQDREGVGYALTREMHREDMELMKEMGANTIRLAHYQHDQYFYDLCDEAGMVVWAEIPYISEHMPEGNQNTASQMTELIVQNYNHPSIICWGLSNEITSSGGVSDDLVENHRRLNDLCHQLDTIRPTAMAHVFMLSIDEPLVKIPDICSYNLYYGWYLGEASENDRWFDTFHETNPQTIIGLSEYGADANPKYHTADPERGDYTEAYQAEYHEHMLSMWEARPFIWAMHVWNMFDFAADGRDEGGKHGINQKGLVTFDRKIKKDAFYIYKAYLSKIPFVHLCGSRYVERSEKITKIKVYSNLSKVALYVDGMEYAAKEGKKVFVFEVPISGEHEILAKAGGCSDTIHIRKTEKSNPDYVFMGGQIINWFEKEELRVRKGYYSIKDTIEDIKKSPEGAVLLDHMMSKVLAARGDVAHNVKIPEEMQRMMDRTPLNKMLKQVGELMTPESVVALNKALSEIPKL